MFCIALGHIQPERATGQVNSAYGEAEWATDPWALRVKGLIVLVSPN